MEITKCKETQSDLSLSRNISSKVVGWHA